jgi:hypothetical protein
MAFWLLHGEEIAVAEARHLKAGEPFERAVREREPFESRQNMKPP